MDKALFEQLTHSMTQMNEIIEGTRQPSRASEANVVKIKEIRRASGLSQSKFADLISVSVDTLRDWEQGRRSPTGPTEALLRAIVDNPQHALQALNRWRHGYAIQKAPAFRTPMKVAQCRLLKSFAMTRNRAERRHHMVRLKRIRCRHHTTGDGGKKTSGICFRTPCICSCWMCGHRRYHNDPRVSEIRTKARYVN